MADPGIPPSFPPPRRRKASAGMGSSSASTTNAPVETGTAATHENSSPVTTVVAAAPLELSPLSWTGLGALLLAVGAAPFLGGSPLGAVYEHDTALAALRILVLIAAMLLCFSLPKGDKRAGSSETAALGLLWLTVALTVVSLLVHSRFLTSPVLLFALLPGALDWLCYGLVFTLSAWVARRSPRAAMLLILALTIGGGGAALSAAREYGEFAQMGMRDHRAQGPFFSPNFLAGFLALTLPIVTAWFVAARERMGALGLGAVAAVIAGALAATGSRAGIGLAMLGLIIAFVLALLTQRGRLPWGRVGTLLAAIALLGFAFRGPITTRAEAGGGQEHSGAYRTMTWKGTLAMAKANPLLGTGPGTFPYRFGSYALVARTDLAHSSYLQIAAEQGFPALLATAGAIAATLLTGVFSLFRRRTNTGHDDDDSLPRLLLCGLVGGVAAASARNIFDSEWSLLGNGLPFWAAAGLVVGFAPPAPNNGGAREKGFATFVSGSPIIGGPAERSSVRGGVGILSAVGLVLALCLFFGATARDRVMTQMANRQRPDAVNSWPPDPTVLYYAGKPDQAAAIEPTGKRWYQLARVQEREGNINEAIKAYRNSVQADPNALQTWRKLAETQAASGDNAGAVESWRALVRLQEGPVGQVRAIPELTETHAAFAYAALAQNARQRGNEEEARSLYEKAASIVEEYSRTSPLYQQMELASAQILGTDVTTRRNEVRELYRGVVDALVALAPTKRNSIEWETRRQAANARFEKFITPETNGGTVGTSTSTPQNP